MEVLLEIIVFHRCEILVCESMGISFDVVSLYTINPLTKMSHRREWLPSSPVSTPCNSKASGLA